MYIFAETTRPYAGTETPSRLAKSDDGIIETTRPYAGTETTYEQNNNNNHF